MISISRRRAFRLVAPVLASLLALGAAEVGVRGFLRVSPPRLRIDAKLGWRCVEDYAWTGFVTDAAGRSRRITYTTDARGFRASCKPRPGRPRILVLGDSFTQAAAVSADETYYALLGARLDADIFAYGAGGYGTLQELMILDEELDRVRPDLVLWQFCTNDLINNDLALESGSRWDNNGMVRPYLQDDGRVIYALPKAWPRLRSIGDWSKLAWVAFVTWDRSGAHWGGTVEEEVAREGEAHAGFAHSVAITAELFRRVRRRCGDTPVVVFSADEREPYHRAIVGIVHAEGIGYLDGVPAAVREAAHRGVPTLAADCAHWNDNGHRICAEQLARALASHRGLATAR